MDVPIPRLIIFVLWLAWLIYWIIAARTAKTTRQREQPVWLAVHTLALLAAGLLYGAPKLAPLALQQRFVPDGALFPMIGTVLVAVGLVIAVWARHHLGTNWSGMAALKQQHTLIRSGPYHAVRHPIYSGLLLALLGTAIAIGAWRSLVGFVIALLVFLHRMRFEEAFMAEAFGDEYARYRRASWRLIPLFF